MEAFLVNTGVKIGWKLIIAKPMLISSDIAGFAKKPFVVNI